MSNDKKDYGKGKTPGYFCVLAQSAVVDQRFKRFPQTFRVLAMLGNYTNRQGVCWPNQITIGKIMGIGQPSVSKHIKKLMEFGYLKYAKKHPGLKGNKYFMVFDNEITEEDAKAIATATERSDEEPLEFPEGPKMTDKPVDKKKKSIPSRNNRKGNSNADIPSEGIHSMHSEGIHNTSINNDIYIKGKEVLIQWQRKTEELSGQHFTFNDNHINVAISWLQSGMEYEKLVRKLHRLLQWYKDKFFPRQEMPRSIKYFDRMMRQEPKRNDDDELERFVKAVARNARP